MSDTIRTGDYIIVLKNNVLLRFNRGDIVAFTEADDNKRTVFVKRIAALPGDSIVSRDTGLIINDNLYPHDSIYELVSLSNDTLDKDFAYLHYLTKGDPMPAASYPDFNGYLIPVPERSYFMIGDNYYSSMDSRFWGFIDQNELIGKVMLIF